MPILLTMKQGLVHLLRRVSANTVSDSNTPLKSQKKMTSIVVLNCKTTARDAGFKLWMTLMETQNQSGFWHVNKVVGIYRLCH